MKFSFQIGEELERMHPTLYTNVTRQITRASSSDSKTVDTASVIVSAVARDLFRSNITWGKVNECRPHINGKTKRIQHAYIITSK